ncbi:MAG: alpha-hydroxy-acid oxidizing protein [Lachnospiraceae bacterium]|nr:alpha-hydroxy-acid oxidizing protein [Lachnospiraceae bacterium]
MKKIRQGDSNRLTREYFDSLFLEMRHIDGREPDTSFTLYGEKFDTPIMTAALSHLEDICEDAMAEIAKGAVKAGAVNWAGMGDEEELQRITRTGAKTIKIIKPYEDNNKILDKIGQAKACGALAVGMDVDYAFGPAGERADVSGHAMAPKSVEEIREFASASSLPFIIKGVLSERDAYKALCAGAGGIVVSHHHGIMDYAVPPLKVLPAILKVVSGQIPVFVDCGISSGMDAFKALALGASAVCVGHAIMTPLKEQGADGVCAVIKGMNDELKGIMAKTGCYDLSHMDKTVVHKI